MAEFSMKNVIEAMAKYQIGKYITSLDELYANAENGVFLRRDLPTGDSIWAVIENVQWIHRMPMDTAAKMLSDGMFRYVIKKNDSDTTAALLYKVGEVITSMDDLRVEMKKGVCYIENPSKDSTSRYILPPCSWLKSLPFGIVESMLEKGNLFRAVRMKESEVDANGQLPSA